MPNLERRLQAIMFTDILGYSAMMGSDEAATIRLVQEHRDLVRGVLARHQGREQRTIGDAFLVLFDSSVNAVACAIDIQEKLLARNQAASKRDQIWLRIGVHAGDVMIDEDGELASDAVNIAARVEPLAPVGGICVTDVVAAQVRPHVARRLEPMAPVPMKNIASPPSLFRIVVAPVPTAPRRLPWKAIAALVAAPAVLLAVYLGWQALNPPPGPWPIASADPVAQERFEAALQAFARADSRTEQLALQAQAADPASPYAALLYAHARRAAQGALELDRAVELVEGSDGPQARLIRLVDASVQEQAGGVGMHVGSDLVAQWDAWGAANPDDAFGQYLRAAHYPIHGTEADFHGADPDREHLNIIEMREFLESHPDWPMARIVIAQEHAGASDAETPALVAEGLRRCPECASLHVTLGYWLMGHDRLDEARLELVRAIELDPGARVARHALASIALRKGDEAERARLVSGLMAAEEPAQQRAEFGVTHAHELLERGRWASASALFRESVALLDAAGDADTAMVASTELAFHLLSISEASRAREVTADVEARLLRPELGALSRDVAAIRVHDLWSTIAWVEGDVAAARAVLERIERIPPDRAEKAQLDPALRDARVRVAVLEGRMPAEEDVGNLQRCASFLERARVYTALNDERAVAELHKATDPEACPGQPSVRVQAHVALAERATDPAERASHLEAVDALWPDPDPDLVVTRRRAALGP